MTRRSGVSRVARPARRLAWHLNLEFELRRIEHFPRKATARAKVAAWIEEYSTIRRHPALGMLSPVAYEQALAAGEVAPARQRTQPRQRITRP